MFCFFQIKFLTISVARLRLQLRQAPRMIKEKEWTWKKIGFRLTDSWIITLEPSFTIRIGKLKTWKFGFRHQLNNWYNLRQIINYLKWNMFNFYWENRFTMEFRVGVGWVGCQPKSKPLRLKKLVTLNLVQTLETLDLDLGLTNCDIFMLICNQKSKSNTILEKQTPSVCFIVFWEPSALPWILIYYELLWNNCFPFIRITYIYMQYTHM